MPFGCDENFSDHFCCKLSAGSVSERILKIKQHLAKKWNSLVPCFFLLIV